MGVEAERIYAVNGSSLAALVQAEEAIPSTPAWSATPTSVLQIMQPPVGTDSVVSLDAAGLGAAELAVDIPSLGTGHAELLVLDPTALTNAERPLLAAFQLGSRPAVAVVRGRGPSRCDAYRPVVFAGAAPIGSDVQPCVDVTSTPTGGEVALFVTDGAAQLLTWPAVPTPVTFPPAPAPFVVTVDLEGHDVLDVATWKEWWVHAGELFALNRVGATLDSSQVGAAEVANSGTETAAVFDVASTAVQGCWSITPPFPRLTLLFVDEVRDHAGRLVRGLWCPAQSVAVISLLLGSPTEIPHELAHAFGVAQHMASSLDPLNLMTPHASDATAAVRTRFTVGQVFTMNFASYSFLALQRPSGERRWCPDGCPRLVFDVPRGR